MSTKLSTEDTERLLAEADELIQRINSGTLDEMMEEHRLQFEIHVQNLKRIKSEVQGKIEKGKTPNMGAGTEGVHEAILDIVKAMRGMTNFLT